MLLCATTVAMGSLSGTSGAATPTCPFTVDLSNREDVRRFFFSTYQASEEVPAGWTGDVVQCNAGTVSRWIG